MSTITQYGTLNTASLVVPDLYIQIESTAATSLSGAQSNIIGVVGTASWGAKNTPITFGSSAERIGYFGPMQDSVYDLATIVSTSILQGASNFIGVRVTDGTDTYSSYTINTTTDSQENTVTISSKYTGTYGNNITLQFSNGSAANSIKATVQIPSLLPEFFDNIATNGSNGQFWKNFSAAINNGLSSTRGPSQIITVQLGNEPTVAPTLNTIITLSGGTDGNSGVTSKTLLGLDSSYRTGMYALRSQQCSLIVLSGVSDNETWSEQAQFGISEGAYMITSGPSGEVATDAVSRKKAAGVDNYSIKVLFGDWIYWYDSENSSTRLIPPTGFVAGRLSALSPQLPSLNKQLYGIVGSQKSGLVSSGQNTTYSTAELANLFENGLDVICNPSPGGSYWSVRGGINSSSNSEINGDEYTRVTNFIAETISDGMGIYIGQPISASLFSSIEATLSGFLSDLETQGIIGTNSGSIPYSVICSDKNNPQSRTALGFLQADVSVTYFGINKKFIVNITGGAAVAVSRN